MRKKLTGASGEKRELMRAIESRLPRALRRSRAAILRACRVAGVVPDSRKRWRYSEVLQAIQDAHNRDLRNQPRDAADPKTRKLMLEGDRIELELQTARGEAVPMAEHLKKVGYLAELFSSALSGIPDRLAAYTRDARVVEIARGVCEGVCKQVTAEVEKSDKQEPTR
jgi:hypothetical protein